MTYNEARQCKKNEALNKIIFTYSKYFEYESAYSFYEEIDSKAEQRDKEVSRILDSLESELRKLKNQKI